MRFLLLQADDILLPQPSSTSDTKLEQPIDANYDMSGGLCSRTHSIRIKSGSVNSSFRSSDMYSRNDLVKTRGNITGGSFNIHNGKHLRNGSMSNKGIKTFFIPHNCIA